MHPRNIYLEIKRKIEDDQNEIDLLLTKKKEKSNKFNCFFLPKSDKNGQNNYSNLYKIDLPQTLPKEIFISQ